MDIVELIEIALANTEPRRVEVAALEPADVAMEAVSGLAQIVSELVDNSIAFSEPAEKVRITGLFDQGSYLISISDRGVGLPDDLIAELNRLLDNSHASSRPEPRLGIAFVARLAIRHGIEVKLVPGVPGTTARVTMPSHIASSPVEGDRIAGDHRLPQRQSFARSAVETDRVFASSGDVGYQLDTTSSEHVGRSGSGVVAMSEEGRRKAEAFLAKVFGPLIEGPGVTRRHEPAANGIAGEMEKERSVASGSDIGGTVTSLRTRVPGENFSLMEDDPSTIAAERAIDIRTALSRFEQGRRAAREREDS